MNYAIKVSLSRLVVFWAITIPIGAFMLASMASAAPVLS